MTLDEKKAVLARIVGPALSARPVRSPWSIYSFSVWIQENRLLTSIAALLLIFLSGNGVVFAAERTLPGDALYPIKVDIVEPLRGALISSPVAKAEYQASIADRRLSESETLAIQGKLDAPKQAQITALLDKHARDLETALDVAAAHEPQRAAAISVDYQAGMNAHAAILGSIVASSQATTSEIAAAKSIASTSVANAMALASRNGGNIARRPIRVAVRSKDKADDSHPVAIARSAKTAPVPMAVTATMSPIAGAPVAVPLASPMPAPATTTPAVPIVAVELRVQDDSTTTSAQPQAFEARKQKMPDAFAKRKQEIQSLIAKAESDAVSASTTSPFERAVLDNVHSSLNQASQSLKDADSGDDSNDDASVTASLNDSERSVKEANIILKAGLRLGRENRGFDRKGR